MDTNLIKFEDFEKVEIKIGLVLSAERVPETDKLLKLEVDFNEENNRTIVSGIAHAISPEEIIGNEMPFVTNLEPRTIKGIESQGMIMVAIDEEDKPVLLHPTKEVSAGTEVR